MKRSLRAAPPLLVAAALLIWAAPVSAQRDDVRASSRTTFDVQPATGRVRAEMTVTLVNRARRPLRWWGPIRTPDTAEDVRFGGRGVTTDVVSDATGVYDTINFPALRRGQRQRITLSYDLTTDALATPDATYLTTDYARFCWHGGPTERGRVRADLPAGWSAVTEQAATKTSVTDGGVQIVPAAEGSPADFFACTDAFVTDLGSRVYVLGPSEQVITLDHWADDPAWESAMTQIVGRQLRELEAIVGRALPLSELTIQQAYRMDPYGRPTDYVAGERLVLVGHRPDVPGAATVALARTWFNTENIAEPWLAEGLATWAGLKAADAACPTTFDAGAGSVDLSEWHVRNGPPSNWDEDREAAQLAAACSIIEDVADALGAGAMADVIASLLDRREPATRAALLAAIAEAPSRAGDDQLVEGEETPEDLAIRRLDEHGLGRT